MAHMFVPGPVDVDPEVMLAQTRAMIPHRSKEFETLYRQVEEKSRLLFNTDFRVFLAAASGSGLQEAAVRNFVKEKVLVCINGAFAERWYEVAVSNGKQVDRIDAAWDQPVTPEMIPDKMRGKDYEAILLVHNETSTGLQNPVKEIASAVHEISPNTLICVDTVSSLGGVKIEMDKWGLDMVLSSSQKCLALPPGLALGAVSDRALDYARGVPDRGWYFDLIRMEKHRLKDSTPATPAMSLIYALDYQLDRILDEGLENRYQRHESMAKRVQVWALDRGLSLFAPEGFRSQTVTTVINEKNWDISELNKFLLQKDMRIANGYGQLKGKTFRIAHMGETTLEDVERLLQAMEEFMVAG